LAVSGNPVCRRGWSVPFAVDLTDLVISVAMMHGVVANSYFHGNNCL
jgi:hypothetical protein